MRRLATIAFTPRRVAAMEPLVRELTAQSVEKRLSSGRADLIRDPAWDLPALVIFRVLGIPDEDVARVKAGAESRLLLMWGRPNEDEQIRLVEGMAAFWRYAETLVASRAEQCRDDFTSDLLLARDGDLPALNHQEVTQIVYELLFAGHETTTGLIGNALRRLLTERHAWEEICRDPSLIPNAIEEVLRFDSSVIAWRRKTTEAVEIGGVSSARTLTAGRSRGYGVARGAAPGCCSSAETFRRTFAAWSLASWVSSTWTPEWARVTFSP